MRSSRVSYNQCAYRAQIGRCDDDTTALVGGHDGIRRSRADIVAWMTPASDEEVFISP